MAEKPPDIPIIRFMANWSGRESLNGIAGENGSHESEAKSRRAGQAGSGPMPMRQSLLRDRRTRALGLARSFGGKPAGAWRGLRNVCRKLAQAFSHHQGRARDRALRARFHQSGAQFLLALRNADHIRARALTAYGEYPARAFPWPHRPAAALSRRGGGTAGVGLYRRAFSAAQGFSGRGLAARQKEQTCRSRRDVLR